MSVYRIEGTDEVPEVEIDLDRKVFRMNGFSSPENVIEVYSEILNWVDKFGEDINLCEFDFLYINTISKKMIFEILERIAERYKNGQDINVKWYYDINDIDMKELGEEFSEFTEISFDFIAK